jgi:predicted nuclease of predicted toxin-antitoxin system
MELRFLVDTQLPSSLAEFLKRRGFDASHVIDYPKGALTSDKEIIAIAKNELRIIITKDSDFMDYFLLKGYPPAILLLQLGNIKNSELFALLKRFMEQITSFYATEVTKFLIIKKDKIIFF